ncbi:MAG: Appr-1-p processing protein, partial [Methyloprofundus sp.]|nr:Appr-1-p processing protein [Methyloprofundus sp.]
QKLAWFLERYIEKTAADNPLKLKFSANRYGPYTNRLDHLLNAMDGSYLHCEKRIANAEPLDVIRFDDGQKVVVHNYLSSDEAKPYQKALQATSTLIDGFESPLGMELLATVDWLIFKEGCAANLSAIKQGISQWPGGHVAAQRKLKLFDDRLLGLALHRLESCPIH